MKHITNFSTLFIISRRKYKKTEAPFTLKKFSPIIAVILKYSKDLNINLNIKDDKGRTPLHYMFQVRSRKEVKKFLRHVKNEHNIEFDLDSTDQNGKTPIQMSPISS